MLLGTTKVLKNQQLNLEVFVQGLTKLNGVERQKLEIATRCCLNNVFIIKYIFIINPMAIT